MHLKALTLYLSSEFDNYETEVFVYIKFKKHQKSKNRDVDMNPNLSRNEPLLQLSDFDRACHIC